MSQTANGQSGFTLVEAMVSLFVFALLATGSVTMLMQSVDTQKRVVSAEESLRELQTIRALLASDVAQIIPRRVRGNDGGPAGFEGLGGGAERERRMILVRGVGDADPVAAAVTSLVVVEYLVDDQGRLLRRTRESLNAGAEPVSRERLLLEGARNIRFAFHDGVGWRDTWSVASGSPPEAVAVIATLPRYGDVRVSAYAGLK